MLYTRGIQREEFEKRTIEVRQKFEVMKNYLDERSRRLWAATEAKVIGHSRKSIVSKATGMSRTTIVLATEELEKKTTSHQPQGIRAVGGGRKRLRKTDATLLKDLQALVEPTTRGDPESPLRWTCKSTRQIADTGRWSVMRSL